MRLLGLVLGFCALGFAQANQPSPPEIHGTIQEFGTHTPIAGVRATLFLDPPTEPLLSGTTDSQGAFDFQPGKTGHYTVRIQAEGYRQVQGGEIPGAAVLAAAMLSEAPVPAGPTAESRVVITTGNPKEEIRFTLVRPGEMRGRVIDEDTGEPLAKVPVNWVTPSGGRTEAFFPGPQRLTDDQGEFILTAVLPGEYAIQTHPRVVGPERIVARFSEDDVRQTDEDLETGFWPGGRDFSPGAVLSVSAGQTVNVGAIKVRKTTYYRARVHLSEANCPPGESADAQLYRHSATPPYLGLGRASCGADFLIRTLEPGAYTLYVASAGRTPETRAEASVPLEIRDRNVEFAVSLERGTDIEGEVIVPEGVQPPIFNELTVSVRRIEGPPIAYQPPFSPDSQGHFHLSNLPQGGVSVAILRASAGFYLREVRFNGRAQSLNAFAIERGASTQFLQLMLDNKPSAITGTVEDSDRPVGMPYVVAAKWPFGEEMLTLAVHRASGGADGKFQMGGLPPGEYRVLAVADSDKDKLNEPGVLNRLFAAAEKVTLDGGTQDVRLRLIDPNR